ncbi:MAG: response regulator transcription factor [Cyclobacteriaceae bacterium]|nr:response regulator transcription factor [Cyclobacteriaceae bacterium]
MKAIIVEDERKSVVELKKMIRNCAPEIEIVASLESISESVSWLQENPHPDLIFMDIQLADGLSFKIFNEVKIDSPVIFCTAYDKYALDAFKANGMGYLLKPVLEEDLKACLHRVKSFRDHFQMNGKSMLDLVNSIKKAMPSYKTSYLVSYKSKMLPISVMDIIFFSLKDGQCKMLTKDGSSYFLAKNLEELENELDPKLFFRANRQFLVGYGHIKEVQHYMNRKLEVLLQNEKEEPIIVSKEKSTEFLSWMDNR